MYARIILVVLANTLPAVTLEAVRTRLIGCVPYREVTFSTSTTMPRIRKSE